MSYDVWSDPGVPGPPGCHDNLSLVCGTCKTFPKGWLSHAWRCRTRGKSVSCTSHACERYRPDQEFIDYLDPPLKRMSPQDELEAMHLPIPPDFLPRRLQKARDRKPVEPVQTDLRRHTGGIVYFIDCGTYTKIGFTAGLVEQRMAGIMNGNPFDLSLWALVRGTISTERKFQRRYSQYCHRLEWFTLPTHARNNIKAIVKLLGGQTAEDWQ